MKNLIISLVLLVSAIGSNAQKDCNGGYFASKKGTKFETTVYDKKDKPQSVMKYEITKSNPTSAGIDIVMAHESYDKKGKLTMKSDMSVKCSGGQVFVDVNHVVGNTTTPNTDMEVSVTGDKIMYPNALTKGQVLPDASSEVKSVMKSSGMTIMTVNIKILNRKVDNFETIETPAGKFECVKISYQSELKMGILGTTRLTTTEYLSKGVGVVKSESFNKKGEKISSNILTKFEN